MAPTHAPDMFQRHEAFYKAFYEAILAFKADISRQLLTCMAAGALAARGEVERLAHGQFRHVLVLLRHVHRRALRDELAQAAAVVGHAPAHLRARAGRDGPAQADCVSRVSPSSLPQAGSGPYRQAKARMRAPLGSSARRTGAPQTLRDATGRARPGPRGAAACRRAA